MKTKDSNITQTLQKVLDYCSDFVEEYGYPPSVREIGSHMGVSSTATVYYYLSKLQEQGLLRKSPNRNRAIEVVRNNARVKYITTPLIGNISAGLPKLAEENVDDIINLPAGLFKGDDLFALRVKGDSMINAGIFNKDIIIVRKQETANNNDIVVALIDNEATVKRFIKQKDKIILRPENDTMTDMVFDNVSILGIVVGSIRNF